MAIFKYKNTDGTWETFESPGAVKYFEQNLTDEEKAQARDNIGAYVERYVLYDGGGANVTTITLPEGQTFGNYDLIFMQLASSSGGNPAGTTIIDPKAVYAVPTVNMIDINGNSIVCILEGISSSSNQLTIKPISNVSTALTASLFKMSGFKFKTKEVIA